jgi:hypothetical protein
MLLLVRALVLILVMVLVCPFCKSGSFQNARGLAVHTSSCTKAQDKLRAGISSRKRKQEDDKGREIPAKSRFSGQTPGPVEQIASESAGSNSPDHTIQLASRPHAPIIENQDHSHIGSDDVTVCLSQYHLLIVYMIHTRAISPSKLPDLFY